MKAFAERVIHYVALVTLTVVSVGVMWYLSTKGGRPSVGDLGLRPLATVATVKAPVALYPVEVGSCEVVATYAGKIRPWETYQIAFEVPGRVLQLGTNTAGEPLDEGDLVEAGQVLAQLDDRVYRAQKSEAAARIELAASELERAQQARLTSPTAVSDTQVQQFVTDLALAKAQHEIAVKNLEDTTLRAPVVATISKRLFKAGESVSAHQIVFELVETDRVLLVVDVPESQIRELEQRKRQIQAACGNASEPVEYRAHVRLEGRNRFGEPWTPLEGRVHQIAEVADQRTGLFEVEIELENAHGLLRPGMVATADIVTAELPGYLVPESAVLFRGREAHLFTVDREKADMEMLYWNVGETELCRARRVDLGKWIDQGENVIIPADQGTLDTVVVRGQYRLADGQLVRPVDGNDSDDSTARIDVASEDQR